MDRTVDTPDERLNDLIDKVARLTGENVIRLQLEAEVPEELIEARSVG
jgi:hypothetical protein